MAYRRLLRAPSGLSALAVALAALALGAAAEPPQQPAPPSPDLAPHWETWAGGQAFGAAWSTYSGAAWAPFGSVREDGFRLRVVLGAGVYRGGGAYFGDILVGYHEQLGPVTLKVFAGLAVAEHSPIDPTSMLAGTTLGPKALAETWWSITDKAWASLDLAIALPNMQMADRVTGSADPDRVDYTGRLRLGWRLWPELSVGLEGGAGGPLAPTLQSTWRNGMAHAGGFLRYEWTSGEVSISGGVVAGGDEREGHTQPFGTVSVLTRF